MGTRYIGIATPVEPSPSTVNVSRRGLIAGGVLLVVATCVVTLLFASIATQESDKLPDGCAPKDRRAPGCRPVKRRPINESTVALFAIVLAPVGAVGAAMLTSGAARRTQAAALKEESVRLTKQLKEERVRLDAQLAHERTLRDLDHLRVVVDEANHVLEECVDFLLRALSAARIAQAKGTEKSEAFTEAFGQAVEAWGKVVKERRRLNIRVLDEDIVETYDECTKALKGALNAFGDAPFTEQTIENATDMRDLAANRHADFLIACKSAIGTRTEWRPPRSTG